MSNTSKNKYFLKESEKKLLQDFTKNERRTSKFINSKRKSKKQMINIHLTEDK